MSKIDATARLAMQGISKRFGSTIALDHVDIDVAPGEVLALVGENGAGKSTLMNILSGAVAPDSGTMFLDGRSYAPRGPIQSRNAGVMMVHQELSLVPHMTVEENVMLGMEPTRRGILDQWQMRRKTREVLAQLEHDDINPRARICTLSIGKQQIVEIARGLAFGCRVLVLDEPTSSLASTDAQRLFRLIRRMRAEGHAVIYISHFLEEVTEISDRFIVLRDGRRVGDGLSKLSSHDDIVALMAGRRIENLYPRNRHVPGEVLLSAEELCGTVKPACANLTLRKGEILGIAGLVGSGRTELLRTLFGLDSVRRGTIRLGVHIGAASPAQRWAQGMGFLSEDRRDEGLALSMSIRDNLTLTRLEGFGPHGLIYPKSQKRAARYCVNTLEIRCRSVDQSVRELSGGNQQKVAIGRLLQHGVDVLLLDEPTRGIDVQSKASIYQMMSERVSALGSQACGIILASSHLPELLGLCDRIAVMHKGRLGPSRPVAEWNEHQLLMEATGVNGKN